MISPPTVAIRTIFVGVVALFIGVGHTRGADSTHSSLQVAIAPIGDTQAAPHGKGNVYAPDVLFENGLYRMWFGGQGRDGHDRIHLAESRDGKNWQSRGVVLEDATANHVNDPSIVKQDDTYFMYYTRAVSDVLDEIALAMSRDGIHWTKRGAVLRPSPAGNWDSLVVGRPSVLHEGNAFRMWYDGRRDLPISAPAQGAPKSPNSARAVGYAESNDGITWKRPRTTPVFAEDAGGVHVTRTRNGYAMVYEGWGGTQLATSADGLAWKAKGLLSAISGGDVDRFGHVTPFLFLDARDNIYSLFVGAASAASWDHNVIARINLSAADQVRITSK